MSTNGQADKNLGEIVSEVSEKASLLVRQEIELAKAEVAQKIGKLTRGAAIGVAAGVFLVFGITMFFHGLAWFLDDLFNWEGQIWAGFAVVTALLFLLALLSALLAEDRARPAREEQDLMAESPEIIRASIEETRRDLAFSVNDLRSKVAELTDWRRQLAENRNTALVGAAVAGFVVGGGIAATFSLFSGRRRR